MEDPNLHLLIFLKVCNTLQMNRFSTNAICLRLFPFSLTDKARAWFHSLPPNSITMWEELIRAFLAKYFPPSKTMHLRNQITISIKGRIRRSMRLGSGSRIHYRLKKWMLIEIFYGGVIQQVRST